MTLRRMLLLLGILFTGLGVLFLKIALIPAPEVAPQAYNGAVETAAPKDYGKRGKAFMVSLGGVEGEFLLLDHLERRPQAEERIGEAFPAGRRVEMRVYPRLSENRGAANFPHEVIEAWADGKPIFARSDWVEGDDLLRWMFGLFGLLFAGAGGYLLLWLPFQRR